MDHPDTPPARCSFCGADTRTVRVVAGADGRICVRCVRRAAAVLGLTVLDDPAAR